MKKYTHAWLALKALECLEQKKQNFAPGRKARAERLLSFMADYPSTFVRGAWFPDSIIRDNVDKGAHTWKYTLDGTDKREVRYRPPEHNQCLEAARGELDTEVGLVEAFSSLPDRCEALSQGIRDLVLITNKTKSGDVVAFNNSQVALLLLMLSHYVCDAHVPVHCDARDLYKPSKVHPDLEAFWEKEIKKHYRVSTKTEKFDLDEMGKLQRRSKPETFAQSVIAQTEHLVAATQWEINPTQKGHWRAYLGKTNKNLWDYMVSVCLVSFHTSLRMFPDEAPYQSQYDTIRIMKDDTLKASVIAQTPAILADAITSVAVVWLATWERWELLAKEHVS